MKFLLFGNKNKQPTTHLGVNPNAMVELAASVSSGVNVEFDEVLPNGSRIVPFDLPADMFFIVTDYACGTDASTGLLELVAANAHHPGTGAGRLICKTNLANQLTGSGNMTSGAVFSDAPILVNFSDVRIRGWMRLHGYLINKN